MKDSPPNTTRQRQMCHRCLRAQSGCICHLTIPITTQTSVTIVQHPYEEKHVKGTGRLLHLNLLNSQLIVKEKLENSIIENGKQSVLLYPPTQGNTTVYSNELEACHTQLIVLDGTWKKSRKLLHLNPELQTLPRLALPQPLASSLYHIRKSESDQQLSTIEATAFALEALEHNKGISDHLLSCLSQFILQIEQQRQQQSGKFTLK